MKQLVVLVGCCVVLSALCGCKSRSRTESGVDVIIKGGGKFPEFLVGTWKNDRRNWEFVFEPDGTISSAVIDNGMVRVTPSERVITIQLKNGGTGVYELGQWTVEYTPDTRELAVEVVVEHFRLDVRSSGIKGSSTDLFVGPVSEDSQVWETEWFTFPKNIAYSSKEPEMLEFPFDPCDNPFDTLVFKKQKETN